MVFRVFDPSDRKAFRDITADALSGLAERSPVWLDVEGATSDEVQRLGELFGFHPLAVEDARKRQQRPKADVYPDHLFVVLYALDPAGVGDHERLSIREVSIFIRRTAVVTLHREPIDELEIAAHRWADHCRSELPEDIGMLFYTIADAIVDGYFPSMDQLGDRIDLIETAMFENGDIEALHEVFQLKRLLLDVRRSVAPTRDVFNAFTRRELPLLGDASLAYYQDVYDHVIRVTEAIDAYRDTLTSIVEVHLTLVSNKLNQTVRTLTIASIILMSLALIAGIYGMNFEHMPELTWRYGYYMALGTMVLASGVLALIFRRLNWW